MASSSDKRKTALLILAKAKPATPASSDAKTEEGETSAAQDVLDAIKADDAEALMKALRNWHEIACEGGAE